VAGGGILLVKCKISLHVGDGTQEILVGVISYKPLVEKVLRAECKVPAGMAYAMLTYVLYQTN
jgi:hypothetical protein